MKDHRKLPLATYATNLKLHLNNVSSNVDVTLDDFRDVIDQLLA
jgi:hypothetical protein